MHLLRQLIDQHFASNADLKPLIKKKELYGRARLVINEKELYSRASARGAPVITKPFFPRTQFINLHKFENTKVFNMFE